MPGNYIYRDNNRIIIQGVLGITDIHRPLVAIHQGIYDAGFKDIVLDFSGCTAAFSGPMLGLCAQVIRHRSENIEFTLMPPFEGKLKKLFFNANWAHHLDPQQYDPSTFTGYTQVPATLFKQPDEQNHAVNKIVNCILGAIDDIERNDFAALEWSVNEITDNVLTHSESPIGGLVQVSTFQKSRRLIQYIVADAGLGIPTTLRNTHSDITSDAHALDRAIREGVTRDKTVGQGNGLFGSYQICSQSRGSFLVESGYGRLSYAVNKGLQITISTAPYNGTIVVANIDFSNRGLLREALKFDGKFHSPVDFIETHYESDDLKKLIFIMKDEAASFGSRVAGTPVRNKLLNLVKMCPQQKIFLDFSDIPLVSSSFADEVFGKLFAELGPVSFMQHFDFKSLNEPAKQIIDYAISQRMTTL